MPLFRFRCECKHEGVEFLNSVNDIKEVKCSECGRVMERCVSHSIHTKVGSSIDSKDSGNVTKQKNTHLKRMWAGYSHEAQSLKEKISKMADEKIAQKR